MMARDQRYRRSRQARLKARIGLAAAAAAVVGGGAVAVAAVAATSHSAGTTARPAAYAARYPNEGTMLSSAMADWSWSKQDTFLQLAQLNWTRDFSQTTHHGNTLDIQRGIVVLATKKFLVLQSANGSLHLWLLTAATKFQNVSGTAAGTSALTASTTATRQAMGSGNMMPAATLLAGSPQTAAAMLTPTTAPVTVSVQVANTDLTVTVTVTRSSATVSQTATTPTTSMPAPDPITFTQNAWKATASVARGDLAVVVGTRSHWTLHARLVLFSPLSASDVGGSTGNGQANPDTAATPTANPTHW
jgi:hypothetical protein